MAGCLNESWRDYIVDISNVTPSNFMWLFNSRWKKQKVIEREEAIYGRSRLLLSSIQLAEIFQTVS